MKKTMMVMVIMMIMMAVMSPITAKAEAEYKRPKCGNSIIEGVIDEYEQYEWWKDIVHDYDIETIKNYMIRFNHDHSGNMISVSYAFVREDDMVMTITFDTPDGHWGSMDVNNKPYSIKNRWYPYTRMDWDLIV